MYSWSARLNPATSTRFPPSFRRLMTCTTPSSAVWSNTLPSEKSKATFASATLPTLIICWKLREDAKNSGPWSLKVRFCNAGSEETSKRTEEETVQAKASTLTTRPRSTAVAKSKKTPTTRTRTMTTPSLGWTDALRTRPVMPQRNVLALTKTISPTTLATGIFATSGASNTVLAKRPAAVVRPESRPRAPAPTLSTVWQKRAHPPCTPKMPDMTLPSAWPKHSRLMDPRVSVTVSTTMRVTRLSTKPTIAMRTLAGMTVRHRCQLPQCTSNGGKFQGGRMAGPPMKVSWPATLSKVHCGKRVLIRLPKTMEQAMAAKGAGRNLPSSGSRGQANAVSSDTSAVRSIPCKTSTLTPCACAPMCLNWLTCSNASTMEMPLTKPSSTVCGTREANRAKCKAPTKACQAPQRITTRAAPPRPSSGSRATSARITAVGSEEQEIRPGRPPTSAVVKDMKNPAQMPLTGWTPASSEDDIACGRQVMAAATPQRKLLTMVPSGGPSRA
mmetsp:Transcript_109134/g.336895  ORF Transcript_109134/g.336895 Transcript_109134/m.336895 type:complete len:501 (-) Transcript_109134:893-2395(-)